MTGVNIRKTFVRGCAVQNFYEILIQTKETVAESFDKVTVARWANVQEKDTEFSISANRPEVFGLQTICTNPWIRKLQFLHISNKGNASLLKVRQIIQEWTK